MISGGRLIRPEKIIGLKQLAQRGVTAFQPSPQRRTAD
jgi:hypothetical protein